MAFSYVPDVIYLVESERNINSISMSIRKIGSHSASL